MKTKSLTFMMALAIAIVGVLPATAAAQETVKSRIGDLSFTKDFENGYPTDATVKKLYDEMDFQRACAGLYLVCPAGQLRALAAGAAQANR